MAKYRVHFSSYADAAVTVETDATDPEQIAEEAWEEVPPMLCSNCSGWRQKVSLTLGEEWNVETDINGTAVAHSVDG